MSIIIPAHNEERVIERCLSALTVGATPHEVEIVVACNGCNDRTEELAASYGPPVRVVTTAEASKPAALDLGDALAETFPRFYIDADVHVTLPDLRIVAERLRDGTALAAAPRLAFDVERSSWLVRSYLRAWQRTPYVREHMIGSGVYGVSEIGRARWDTFPRIIGDDIFVHSLFDANERVSVPEATFTAHAPRRVYELIRRKSRVYEGVAESRAQHGRKGARQGRRRTGLNSEVMREGPLDTLVYVGVTVLVRAYQAWNRLRGRRKVWERDDSSR